MFRRLLVVAVSATALTALPSFATSHAGPVHDLVQQTALHLGSTLASVTNERMVGVTWRSGTATVKVRWHTRSGWSAWQTADQDSGASDVGIPGTEPLWRPRGGNAVQLSVSGKPVGLTLARVTDGIGKSVRGAVADAAEGRAVLGEVQSRAQWGADESMVRRAPHFASKVVAVTVHHTDNVNGYAPGDVPGMIRADYSYHVQGRGWDDIGYNLLVDQFGRVWEGRRGGLGRATVGAHAQGFNTGTLGVAMLGDMTHTTASPAAENALERVIAYAGITWGFDPTTTVRLTSHGSPRYSSGTVVTLPRVFGHMDTGLTDCPGSLEGRLSDLRELGLRAMHPAPQVLSTTLTGAPLHSPQPVVLSAQISEAITWTETMADSGGTVVATSHGTGTAPQLSWDGTTAGLLPTLPGTYSWTLSGDDGFHPAVTRSGTFEVGLPAL